MSRTPRLRSTAVVSKPTGPAPVTSTRSSGDTPARLTVCSAIAVGSVSAAARVESALGDAHEPRRGHELVPAERAAGEVEEVGRLAAQADRGPAARARAARAAARRSGRARRARPISQPLDRRRRPRRSCPPIRGRAPSPGRANCSSTRCRSVPQMPQCETSTSTSVGAERRAPGAVAPRSRRRRRRRPRA